APRRALPDTLTTTARSTHRTHSSAGSTSGAKLPPHECVYMCLVKLQPHAVPATLNTVDRRNFLKAAAATSLMTSLSRKLAHAINNGTVPTRVLGQTGEKISLVGLGGYHLGMQSSEEESIRIIRTGLDSGVTFLDNCWDY